MSTKKQIVLPVEGMTCSNCALNIEKSLKRAGVEQATVSFPNKQLSVETELNPQQLADLVAKAGYKARLDSEDSSNSSGLSWSRVMFVFCVLVSSIFMIEMTGFYSVPPLLGFLLAIPVLLWGYLKYGKGAVQSIKNGSPNMYVLILLGATVAFALSLYLWLTGQVEHLYFETTTVLITIVLVGSLIEDRAVEKTTAALRKLKEEEVRIAKVEKGSEKVEVPFEKLELDDVIIVNEGDTFPTDGELVSGEGKANEALLTGESKLQKKTQGDSVLGGAVLAEGNLKYKVTNTYKNSTLSEIQQMVQKASGEKAAIQKYADRVSAIFVPLILLIAVAWIFIAYWILQLPLETAIIRGVTILVVSCPCAMGLATPMAIMVGLGVLSDKGIVVSRAPAIESMAQLKHLLLDKTGTLTTGDFKVEQLRYPSDWETAKVNRVIYSLEQYSSHPVAHALSTYFKTENDHTDWTFTKVDEHRGMGVEAVAESGEHIRIGSPKWIQEGEGDVIVWVDGQILAEIELGDQLKPDVEGVLSYFRKQKIHLEILSGDQRKNVIPIADKLQIEAQAELKPEEKLNIIGEYSKADVTAMVGDGINDAPALKKAHVGISFGVASALAALSADVVLMKNSFNALKELHSYSKKIVNNIKQNLFWALIYNLVAIPMAALGVFSPLIAVILMFGSDLVVIGNAWRLKWTS